MPNISGSSSTFEVDFDTLKLKPGAVMQIQSVGEVTHARHEVRFIGNINDKSLLVTLPMSDGKAMWMQVGQTFVLRGFNGIHAYAFTAQVMLARAHPFHYVHFSWPRKVECQLVRHSLRVSISLPADIILADGSTVSTNMLDLSVAGTMLQAPSELGSVGDQLKVSFTAEVDGDPIKLTLPATIRNINHHEGDAGFRIGVGFEKFTQNDGMVLHYFTHTLAQKAA